MLGDIKFYVHVCANNCACTSLTTVRLQLARIFVVVVRRSGADFWCEDNGRSSSEGLHGPPVPLLLRCGTSSQGVHILRHVQVTPQ